MGFAPFDGRDLVRLCGLAPEEIEIRFTGVRPGEKLYEELSIDGEETLPTPHPKLRVASHRPERLEHARRMIARLPALLHVSHDEILRELRKLVPEYGTPQPVRMATPTAATVPVVVDLPLRGTAAEAIQFAPGD